jgi:hypothetical protein
MTSVMANIAKYLHFAPLERSNGNSTLTASYPVVN